MKLLRKSLTTLLAIFFIILTFGRLGLSLSEGWYKEIYPNRFSVGTSALLFFLLTSFAAAGVYFFTGFKHKTTDNLTGRKYLFILTAITILKILLFCIFYVRVELASDFKTYYLVADALSKGEMVLSGYIAAFPHVFGYPYVLSVLFKLFGSSVTTGVLFNLFLSCLSLWIIYFIGKQLENERLGLTASFLYAIMPSSTMYCYLLCSEFVFQVILLSIILLFVYLIKVEDKKIFYGLSFANGILLALLSAIRPNGVILFIALLMMITLFIKKFAVEIPRKILIPCLCAAYIIPYLLTTNLTNAYIEKKIGTNIVSNRIGWNLYVGLNYDSLGVWNPTDSDLFSKLVKEKGHSDAQSEFFNLALERLKQYDTPSKTITFLYRKTMKMWSHDHEVYGYIESAVNEKPWWTSNQRIYKIVRLTSDAAYYILINIAAIGFIYSVLKDKKFNNLILIFILFFLGTIALHLPFEAAARYHNPCIASLCIISAYCIEEKRKGQKSDVHKLTTELGESQLKQAN